MARTEDQSFLIEAAMQLGFATTNDDGDALACTEEQLLEFAKRVQDAAGIKCFHCGATFHSEEDASEHFGITPDETALCLELTALMPVQIIKRVREAEQHTREAVAARIVAEEHEEVAQGQLASIGSYFKGATTVRDAWNLHDSMAGRAIAAEALLAHALKLLENKQFISAYADYTVRGHLSYYGQLGDQLEELRHRLKPWSDDKEPVAPRNQIVGSAGACRGDL